MNYHEIFTLEPIYYIDADGKKCVEMWKPVVGYEGFYEVSDLGRIRGVTRKVSTNKIIIPKILKQRFNNRGYLVVTLRKNGSLYIPYVHKLVIIAFLPNPENKPEGNHKFGIKKDNRLSELECVTKSENIKHTFDVLQRKPSKTKRVLCVDTNIVYESASDASRKLNLVTSSITAVCRGENSALKKVKYKYV